MPVFFEAGGADFDSAPPLGEQATGGQRGPLEIGIFPLQADGVEFGGAYPVGVLAGHYRSLGANWASFHRADMLTWFLTYAN